MDGIKSSAPRFTPRWRRRLAFAVLGLLAGAWLAEYGGARRGTLDAAEIQARIEKEDRPVAPDFVAGLQWINTPEGQALTMAGLKGKAVLLDFWTYG